MTTLPLAEAQAHLSKLVARVSRQHERACLTVHGKPSAVLVVIEDLESLEGTIKIFADADAMRRLHASEAEFARRDVEGRDELARPWRVGAVSGRARRSGAHLPAITSTARRQLTDHLPEAVATTAYESVLVHLAPDWSPEKSHIRTLNPHPAS